MIPVQPNKTSIKFRVLTKKVDAQFSDKLLLEIEILPSDKHEDQRFIKPGARMHAFTFDTDLIESGAILEADAEYLGGPRGGTVQLMNVKIADED